MSEQSDEWGHYTFLAVMDDLLRDLLHHEITRSEFREKMLFIHKRELLKVLEGDTKDE